ncbi:MAG TPA: GxxExxY protein [Oceanospirillales bacterium]|nr:GxxExxY protein [Oceanospirillales bacterium]
MEKDKLTEKIIGCAIEVHRTLGPGLMESTYEKCLAHEFSLNNIAFQKQLSMPVNYKGINLDCGYRIDLLIENLA